MTVSLVQQSSPNISLETQPMLSSGRLSLKFSYSILANKIFLSFFFSWKDFFQRISKQALNNDGWSKWTDLNTCRGGGGIFPCFLCWTIQMMFLFITHTCKLCNACSYWWASFSFPTFFYVCDGWLRSLCYLYITFSACSFNILLRFPNCKSCVATFSCKHETSLLLRLASREI